MQVKCFFPIKLFLDVHNPIELPLGCGALRGVQLSLPAWGRLEIRVNEVVVRVVADAGVAGVLEHGLDEVFCAGRCVVCCTCPVRVALLEVVLRVSCPAFALLVLPWAVPRTLGHENRLSNSLPHGIHGSDVIRENDVSDALCRGFLLDAILRDAKVSVLLGELRSADVCAHVVLNKIAPIKGRC